MWCDKRQKGKTKRLGGKRESKKERKKERKNERERERERPEKERKRERERERERERGHTHAHVPKECSSSLNASAIANASGLSGSCWHMYLRTKTECKYPQINITYLCTIRICLFPCVHCPGIEALPRKYRPNQLELVCVRGL